MKKRVASETKDEMKGIRKIFLANFFAFIRSLVSRAMVIQSPIPSKLPMKTHQKLTTALLVLSTCCLAYAQDSSRRGNRPSPTSLLVRTLDKDGDGVISSLELAKASESLLTLDRDGDRSLSSGEFMDRNSRRRGDQSNSRGSSRRGGGGARPTDLGAAPGNLGDPGIAWYGRLDLALVEAKRSNRPILFMAAASQCGSVPGVF